MGKLYERVQKITSQTVQVGFVDQGYAGKDAKYAAAVQDIDLQVMKKPAAQTAFVLLPWR